MTLLRLTREVARLAERLDRDDEGLAFAQADVRLASPGRGYRDQGADRGGGMRQSRPPLPDPRYLRQIVRERRLRSEFFDEQLFADPAWDILLDLTIARAEHRRVSVTSLCIAAAVPTTTALRWIAQMVESGLLVREQDGEDRRRAFIALSDRAAGAMARYFERSRRGGPSSAG